MKTPYSLTLTKSEREAFDWVGNRYQSSGNDTKCLLVRCLPEDKAWDDEGDITFNLPEHIAWQINKYADEEEYTFPCFDHNLIQKMLDLVDAIV